MQMFIYYRVYNVQFPLTLAMSKIWAAVSVQCQAFLMKNGFLDAVIWLCFSCQKTCKTIYI